jgi:CRP-like cAMP-binding protein
MMPPPLSPEPNLEGIVNSGWDKVGRVADTTAHHTSTRDLFRESEKTEKHKVTRIRNREMQKVGWVIDPRTSILPKWDLLMVSALLFTALVTPVEVAFLEEGQYITNLWIINRIVDVCFMFDIILTFNRAYQDTSDESQHWVFNKWVIARNYLMGWFVLDFFSVVPFWLTSLQYSYYECMGLDGMTHESCIDLEDQAVALLNGTSDAMGATMTRSAVLFRIAKLLRMVKLARVFKASRVLQRALLDYVMNELEWTYAVIKMIKLFTVLTAYAHWQACLWGLISSYMEAEGAPNWVASFKADYEADYEDRGIMGQVPTGLDTYAAALYWSVMTLTSIGYGYATPVNTAERFLCTFYMMMSGLMWTYAIGSVTAIATTLNPNATLYQTTMDSLNYFMRERDLPRDMRLTLREYFTNARLVHQLNDDGELLDKMSPLLQGSVAMVANKKWLDHIWFFRDIESFKSGSDFIAQLAKQLVVRCFIAQERLPVGQLYILRRGFVVKMWRFLGAGKVWGEDMIMQNMHLVDHSQAVALTYVEAYTLRRNDLMDVLDAYPGPATRVHKAGRRMTIQRLLLRYLCRQMGLAGPRSIALPENAKGYVTVNEVASVEQKVDQLSKHVTSISGGVDPEGVDGFAARSASQGVSTALSEKVDALATSLGAVVASQAATTQLLQSLHRRLDAGGLNRSGDAPAGRWGERLSDDDTAEVAPDASPGSAPQSPTQRALQRAKTATGIVIAAARSPRSSREHVQSEAV